MLVGDGALFTRIPRLTTFTVDFLRRRDNILDAHGWASSGSTAETCGLHKVTLVMKGKWPYIM